MKNSKNVVLVSGGLVNYCTNFYGTKEAPSKAGNHLWNCLMVIKNQIVNGEIDSVCRIFHLPDHWTSVAFNVQQWCFFYRDSLNCAIPKEKCKAFTKWAQHLSTRARRNIDNPVPIHPPQTSFQDDSTSCGLLALNALSHYYLYKPLLSPDKISLAYAQMEIVLDLLNGNMVYLILLNMEYFGSTYP